MKKDRVNEILQYSKSNDWNWIPNKENMTDIGTSDNLKTKTLLPKFLCDDVQPWKDYFQIPEVDDEFLETENVCMLILNDTYKLLLYITNYMIY